MGTPISGNPHIVCRDSPLGLPMVLVSYFDTPIDLKSSWRSKNLTRNELEAQAKARACQGVSWKADHIARLHLTTGIIKGGIKVFDKQQTKPPDFTESLAFKGCLAKERLGQPMGYCRFGCWFQFFSRWLKLWAENGLCGSGCAKLQGGVWSRNLEAEVWWLRVAEVSNEPPPRRVMSMPRIVIHDVLGLSN